MKVSQLQKQTPRTLAIKVHQRELRIEYLENRIAELEEKLEQIIQSCQNVKEDCGENNKEIKMLATLVIRDCNLTLKGAQK